jgi:phenylacetate-CoA ligase
MFSDTVRAIERRERELHEKIKNILGIAAKVTMVAPKTITRSEGKAVRVVDKRKI